MLEKKDLAMGQECLRRGEFSLEEIVTEQASEDGVSNKLHLKN